MKGIHTVAWILLIVGGLNWGLESIGYGLENWLPMNLMTLIYALVGISAIIELFTHKSNCKQCNSANVAQPM